MSDHPYAITVTVQEWSVIESLMKQQAITEFTLLDERGKNVLKDGRWDVKEKAKAAKCGCHVTFNPPRPPKHNGRTQMPQPKPMPKVKS